MSHTGEIIRHPRLTGFAVDFKDKLGKLLEEFDKKAATAEGSEDHSQILLSILFKMGGNYMHHLASMYEDEEGNSVAERVIVGMMEAAVMNMKLGIEEGIGVLNQKEAEKKAGGTDGRLN